MNEASIQSRLYPFDPRFAEQRAGPARLAWPDGNLWHDENGYLVRNSQQAGWLPLRWAELPRPENSSEERVTLVYIPDGSWAVAYDPPVGEHATSILYWFCPFQPRIHLWHINPAGERVGSADVPPEAAREFWLERRRLGAQYLARLLMLAADRGEALTLSLLVAEITDEDLAQSAELAYVVLARQLVGAGDPRYRAATRSLTHFMRSALLLPGVERMTAAGRARIDPATALLEKITGIPEAQALAEVAEFRLLSDLQRHAPWYAAGSGRKLAPLPVVEAAGSHSMLELSGTSAALSCRFQFRFDSNAPTRFAVPIDRAEWMPRLVQGVDVIEYLLREYILCDRRRYDLMEEYSLTTDQEVAAFAQTTDNKASLTHCVSFQRKRGDNSLTLLPDPYYCYNYGYFRLRQQMAAAANAWRGRKPVAFWRGSTTGLIDGLPLIQTRNLTEFPRLRLCEAGSQRPETMDFGITSIVQAAGPDTAAALRGYCEQRGILRDPVPQQQMADYKFLVDIDGNANSWGLLSRLLLGCCILKVGTDWEQWFYADLEPWVHYVPVKADLSDLAEQVEWCLANDARAQEIGAAGAGYARLMRFDVEMEAASRPLLQCLRPSNGAAG